MWLKASDTKRPVSLKSWLGKKDNKSNLETKSNDNPNLNLNKTKPKPLQGGDHVIVGADVIGLYPSLDAEQTAEAVRKETINSEVSFEGVNHKEALRYIAVNCDKFEIRKMGLEHLVPSRRFTKGQKPTIRGVDSKSGRDTTDEKWVPKGREPTKSEEKLIEGAVLKIGVKTCFRTHTYKYGDKIFKTKGKGGPTGFSVTGKVAKIRMIRALRKLKRILKNSGVSWKVMFIYVDDWRVILQSLIKGVIFCSTCNLLKFSLSQFREDMKSNESDEIRTARIILEVLNSLEDDLKFTTEIASDFPSKTLSTLDFQMWMEPSMVNKWGGEGA